MSELISIIVPIYILETKLLEKCIDSLLNQTYKNIEIILVNDGTQLSNVDYIKSVCAKDPRVQLIGEKNYGVSHARNKGMDYSKGKYITFVDADDYIAIDYCEKMLIASESYDADIVICGYNRTYGNITEVINCKEEWGIISGKNFLEKVLNVQESVGFSHMKLIRRELIDQNEIKFDEKLTIAEDALFCMQLAKRAQRIVNVKEPLYNYLFNSNSVVRKYDVDYCLKITDSMKSASKYIKDEYSDDENIVNGLNNYIVYHLFLIIINNCFHPHKKGSILFKYQELRQIIQLDDYKEAIYKSDYSKLTCSRKIMLVTLKYKLYIFTAFIALFRQEQFKQRGMKEGSSHE